MPALFPVWKKARAFLFCAADLYTSSIVYVMQMSRSLYKKIVVNTTIRFRMDIRCKKGRSASDKGRFYLLGKKDGQMQKDGIFSLLHEKQKSP